MRGEMLNQLLRKLLQFLRGCQPSAALSPVWQGVYPNFRDVPIKGHRFAEPQFLADTKTHTQRWLHSIPENGLASEEITAEFSLAPLLASVVKWCSGRLCILEVGGGMGSGYAALLGCLGKSFEVCYHVLELEPFAREGANLFYDDTRIRFHHQLPAKAELYPIDLVLFCSSLQYIEDYPTFLNQIFTYKPRFIYILKAPIGDFPTIATGQHNVANTIIPIWFLNQHELVHLFTVNSYNLIYKAMHDRLYDMTNFEPEFRFSKYSHLLFARQGCKLLQGQVVG